jgi:FlaA1/EpsC-like NDP-sugar epimerase
MQGAFRMTRWNVRESARLLLRGSSWFTAIFQAALISASLLFAWLLRFGFALPYRRVLFVSAPILVVIRLVAVARFGLLHGWWRYTSVRDAVDIAKAVTVGSAAYYLVMRYVVAAGFPRSIYVLEAILTAGALAGVRLASRILFESARQDFTSSKRVALIGGGIAAQTILRDIETPGSGYRVVACVDDDATKIGMKIQGVPVLGTVDQLPQILERNPCDEIFIAAPSATNAQMQRIVSICRRTGLRFRTIPALRDIIGGRIGVDQLRDVNLEDLLGRDPVQIDLAAVEKRVRGKVVLVTGAVGSIGSELCRQIQGFAPAKLVCVDQSETGIFYLERELENRKCAAKLVFCVADVGDSVRMRAVLREHRPEIIFHTAAYKHVPVMETNVHVAVKNNVFALLSLLEIAEEEQCRAFVLVSSDKAVRPTSVMGATKRIGELILSCRPAGQMQCVAVRFGNVLGSSGSVVCVFKEQLRRNQPLTVTHPEIRRFFMTTREAVSLVLDAFAVGAHGDILVLDMGEPIRIATLARTLAELSGKNGAQPTIRFTGLRPGEKLYEELLYSSEKVLPTASQKVRKVRGPSLEWPGLATQLEELRNSLSGHSVASIRAQLQKIVPEYSFPAVGSEAGSDAQPALAEGDRHLVRATAAT